MHVGIDEYLAEHYKFDALVKLLGVSENEVLGILYRIWRLAMRRARNGDFSGVKDAEIEWNARWPGKPGLLMRSLRASGFMDKHRLHNWLKHVNGRYCARVDNGGVLPPELRKPAPTGTNLHQPAPTGSDLIRSGSDLIGSDRSPPTPPRGAGAARGGKGEEPDGLREWLALHEKDKPRWWKKNVEAWLGARLHEDLAARAKLTAWTKLKKRTAEWRRPGPEGQKFHFRPNPYNAIAKRQEWDPPPPRPKTEPGRMDVQDVSDHPKPGHIPVPQGLPSANDQRLIVSEWKELFPDRAMPKDKGGGVLWADAMATLMRETNRKERTRSTDAPNGKPS